MENKNTLNNQNNENSSISKIFDTQENRKFSLGAVALIIAGILFIFLLALGTWTDNRFGTHMILSSDLSSAGDQGWFTSLFVPIVGVSIILAGIVLMVLDMSDVITITEEQDNALKIGATLIIGSSAFILALSSISFAAFNWQFFKSEIEDGTANQAYAWISLIIIATIIITALTVVSYLGVVKVERKLYLTLRNSSVALIALGWFVFNLCINSFGAMGGDANVLIAGLTGSGSLLTSLGHVVENNLSSWSDITSKDFFLIYLNDLLGSPGTLSTIYTLFFATWKAGLGNLIHSIGNLENTSHIGQQLIELGSGKEGLIMGVNNSMNSFLIFISLLGLGLFGIPTYGALTYGKEEKTSIMFGGSIVLIIIMTSIYLFLALTPYMAPVEEHGIIDLLFNGSYGGFAPGVIAQPGHAGGIHSAIVYFSDEYNGTVVWWIAESLTFIAPIASFIPVWLICGRE